MTTRTFRNLHSYLTTPFRAFLQIDGHPSLPLTLRAESSETVIQTNGKTFGSVEHLFHHYNKYLAGSALDRATYLANGCHRLLQYLVFEEGPYTRLSIAQTLELSPDEWAEMPPLAPIETVAVATPVENTIDTVPPALLRRLLERPVERQVERQTRRQRLDDLHRRTDAIEQGLNEMRQGNASLLRHLDALETRIRSLDEATLTLNNITAHLQARVVRNHRRV